jgi:hypothetical protein
MAMAAKFEEPKGNPLIRWAIIAVSAIAALAVIWYLYTAFTSVSGVKVDELPPQAIDMLPPPPPPPPPKPEEKPPEPTEAPKPAEVAAPKPDAPAPMTMDADAQAGASGGIAVGSGGGMGAPSSAGTCVGPNCGTVSGGVSDAFYARSLSSVLQQRVQRDSKLSRMVFSADFAIWVSPGGAVTRADLIKGSGDDRRDATLKSLLEGTSGLDAPPASFKFPRRITVRGRRSL